MENFVFRMHIFYKKSNVENEFILIIKSRDFSTLFFYAIIEMIGII